MQAGWRARWPGGPQPIARGAEWGVPVLRRRRRCGPGRLWGGSKQGTAQGHQVKRSDRFD
eukprot:scaffold185907_cov22-Tisochrysis_lutea.AAC.1